MAYLATKYNITLAKKEAKWKADYPELAKRIEQLEEWTHPPVAPGGTTEIMAEIRALQMQIDKLNKKINT